MCAVVYTRPAPSIGELLSIDAYLAKALHAQRCHTRAHSLTHCVLQTRRHFTRAHAQPPSQPPTHTHTHILDTVRTCFFCPSLQHTNTHKHSLHVCCICERAIGRCCLAGLSEPMIFEVRMRDRDSRSHCLAQVHVFLTESLKQSNFGLTLCLDMVRHNQCLCL